MDKPRDEVVMACDLSALNGTERKRYGELAMDVGKTSKRIEKVSGGYRVLFDVDDAQIIRLAEFVGYERRCCPFLSLAIEVEPEGAELWLRLTGPAGAESFLAEELRVRA